MSGVSARAWVLVAVRLECARSAVLHHGGDPLMLKDLFSSARPTDKLLRAADERSGAYSILTGAAANRSFKTQAAINISDLTKNIGYPVYTKMPNNRELLPMLKKG
jgi:hypothetical protein